ncbi:hypothetical protein GGG16DRAFT_105357 [Schizophyllum commune]
MATASVLDQSGPTGTPTCSDGIPSREGTPTPAPFDPKFLKYQTPTDTAETPKDRPRYLRQKIVAIIGYAACLFTGMIPVFYMLECMHIVPRSLHKTHELVYFCFREAIGIMKNGKRVLNLDHFGNLDLALKDMHALFDGPSVLEGEYGQGLLALVPTDIEWHLNHITENWGDDYRKLYPDLLYTYEVYAFPSPGQDSHHYHWYPTRDRKYDHLSPAERQMLQQHEYESVIEFTNPEDSDLNDADATLTADDVKDSRAPPQNADIPVSLPFKPGRQGIIRTSHLKVPFPLFDWAYKMKYRIIDHRHLARGIPAEDVQYFRYKVYPRLRRWFEPTPEIAAAFREVQGKKKGARWNGTQSDGDILPRAHRPAPAPRAYTDIDILRFPSPTGFPPSPSPPDHSAEADSDPGRETFDSLFTAYSVTPRRTDIPKVVDCAEPIPSPDSSNESTPRAVLASLPTFFEDDTLDLASDIDSSTPTATTVPLPVVPSSPVGGGGLMRRMSARLASRKSKGATAGTSPSTSPAPNAQVPKRVHADVAVGHNDAHPPKEKKAKASKTKTKKKEASVDQSATTSKKGKGRA